MMWNGKKKKRWTEKNDLFPRNSKLHLMRLNWIESKIGRKTKLQFWLSKKDERERERKKPTHKCSAQSSYLDSLGCLFQSFLFSIALDSKDFYAEQPYLAAATNTTQHTTIFSLFVFVHNLQYMQLTKNKKREKNCKRNER